MKPLNLIRATGKSALSGISNLALANNSHLLKGAECIQFRATANGLPQDEGGSQLNNHPTICFNLSANYQLYTGFFNTVTNPDISMKVLDKIGEILEAMYSDQSANNSATVGGVPEI